MKPGSRWLWLKLSRGVNSACGLVVVSTPVAWESLRDASVELQQLSLPEVKNCRDVERMSCSLSVEVSVSLWLSATSSWRCGGVFFVCVKLQVIENKVHAMHRHDAASRFLWWTSTDWTIREISRCHLQRGCIFNVFRHPDTSHVKFSECEKYAQNRGVHAGAGAKPSKSKNGLYKKNVSAESKD